MMMTQKSLTYNNYKKTKIGKIAGLVRDRLWLRAQNAIIAIFGETGSGKSYSAITLATLIDEKFNLDKVTFTPEEFLKQLDKAQRGSVIIFDEAGVGIPAREWQSLQNKLLNYVLQTFRYQNICVIFTTPHISFIDRQARHLIHYTAIAKGYDVKKEAFETYWYFRDPNPFSDYPRFEPLQLYENGKAIELGKVYVPLPKVFVDGYEAKARKRKQEIREEAMAKIAAMKEGIRTEIDGRQVRALKLQSLCFFKLYDHVKDVMNYSDRELANILGISNATLSNWVKKFRKGDHPALTSL